MHYPFSVIALRRDQRTEGRETRKASTPIGPGRDAIAKSVMVYTVVPPDTAATMYDHRTVRPFRRQLSRKIKRLENITG